MHPTNRLNLLDVLDELIQLPREQRCARMDELGLSDQDRSSVETWLKYHDSSDSFLENISRECIRRLFGEVESADEQRGFDDLDPPRVSGYEINDLLGQGGMASVWRARQLSTGRDVALKLMNPVLFVSQRARARFDRELRITAHLRHPNIAAVYDGGADSSVCFYAMELVEGEPLDRYVESQKLLRRQMLELMLKVCEVVRHAHQNGVIHRDVKPSNILVDKTGQPRVLDFGLAKALAEVGPEITVSHEGDLAGTPAYMSPEQASAGGNVDTRSDVYSLGVILYRLLTGQPPHDLSGSRFQVLQRISGEEVKPPRSGGKQIDRELEALLLKALAREPQQRYATAAELSEDLSRYLHGEPLSAHLPTLRYLLAKRLRRHWLGATAAAVVSAVLLGTAVFSYIRIAQERTKALASAQRADEQAAIAKAVSEFQESMLASADPAKLLGDKVTVVEAIHAAVKLAATISTLATVLRYQGQLSESEQLHREALDVYSACLPAGHPQIAIGMNNLARVLCGRGEFDQAERLRRKAWRFTEKLCQPDTWKLP